MDKDFVSKINREAWNEAAPIHAGRKFERLLKGFQTPGFSSIAGIKQEWLLQHGIRGKAVFQPCCNNGRDLLSIKNLGAARCFGFDLSDEFIEQGRRLATAGGIDCELVVADVYRLGTEYDGQFDIAYITAGTLTCLPDLAGFFAVVLRLMRPGAWMFMQEMHPIVHMYSMEPFERPWRMRHSYFINGPCQVTGGLDYFGGKRYRGKPCYVFHHKLSDIIQAAAASGLLIERFQERDNDVSGGRFRRLERRKHRLPLSFILTARRPA